MKLGRSTVALAALIGTASCAHSPEGEVVAENWGVVGDPCEGELKDLHLVEMRKRGVQFLDRLEVDLYAKRHSLAAPGESGVCPVKNCEGAIAQTKTSILGVMKGEGSGATTYEALDRKYGQNFQGGDKALVIYDNYSASGSGPKELALKYFDVVRQGGKVLSGQESHITINKSHAKFGIYNYGAGEVLANMGDVPSVQAAGLVMCLRQRMDRIVEEFGVKEE